MNDEALVAVLQRAASVLDASNLSPDLRAAALPKVIELLSTSTPRQDLGGPPREPLPAKRVALAAPAPNAIEAIAQRLKVDASAAELIYAIDSGVLAVIVSPRRLSAVRQPAMRELILLVVVGRQAAGLDVEGTPIEDVRRLCESYGERFYDGRNFMNAVRALADSLRIVGETRDHLKVNPGGYEAAAELIRRITERAIAS